MTLATPFLVRREHFGRVGSTNDVVREWLAAGTPEVCLAVADEQTAGRGRQGRTWVAPPGSGLLLSVGFRPTWLAPDHVWRLAATASLAMAEAIEQTTALPRGTIKLKWPNDLVTVLFEVVRKVAGVLGETDGLGTDDPRVVVGIGVNTNWNAEDAPPDLRPSMMSLRMMSDRETDLDVLIATFLDHLERRVVDLRGGQFAAGPWVGRQLTTAGREVQLIEHDGSARWLPTRGVDVDTGALLIVDRDIERAVLAGDVKHVRLGRV
ncbi:MAG: biotin--[acetyl-CoA-carboxylase] ligase [Chloroflexi bacterium]|nr:biotin--[acetyl-CoA-carboxylase] ligase [Chloroflexota bacterium]